MNDQEILLEALKIHCAPAEVSLLTIDGEDEAVLRVVNNQSQCIMLKLNPLNYPDPIDLINILDGVAATGWYNPHE